MNKGKTSMSLRSQKYVFKSHTLPELQLKIILFHSFFNSNDQGEEINEQNSCSTNTETFGQEHLRRLVFVVGHIAICQFNYLDVSVFNELKRRNNLRQQKKEKDDAAKKKASRRSKGGSTSNLETPRGGSNSKVSAG